MPTNGSQLNHLAKVSRDYGGVSRLKWVAKFTNTQFRERAAQGQLPLETMRVAPVKPQPTLEDTIQHRDVLPQVQTALGLSVPETVDTASETIPATPPTTPAQPQGLVSTLMSLLRGKS